MTDPTELPEAPKDSKEEAVCLDVVLGGKAGAKDPEGLPGGPFRDSNDDAVCRDIPLEGIEACLEIRESPGVSSSMPILVELAPESFEVKLTLGPGFISVAFKFSSSS